MTNDGERISDLEMASVRHKCGLSIKLPAGLEASRARPLPGAVGGPIMAISGEDWKRLYGAKTGGRQ